MNSFGQAFRFTSFGESHGKAIGGIVEGVRAGSAIDLSSIRHELLRRAGKDTDSIGVSPRAIHEQDEVEWLSGVMETSEGLIALGTPIAFLIRNRDAHSDDYEWMKHNFRPGHADLTYQLKYGIRDHRGGGRASARETAARVVAGSLARQELLNRGITIEARLTQIGSETDSSRFNAVLKEVQQAGDTIGGVVECRIHGLPAGVGEPIFDKLQARLAFAMMSINGCKGFSYGIGFDGVHQLGSQLYLNQDRTPFSAEDYNHSEGIYGGISDGADIVFHCAFKPAATLRRTYGGRHDCCIAVRAVPVVEAMTALCLLDLLKIAED